MLKAVAAYKLDTYVFKFGLIGNLLNKQASKQARRISHFSLREMLMRGKVCMFFVHVYFHVRFVSYVLYDSRLS